MGRRVWVLAVLVGGLAPAASARCERAGLEEVLRRQHGLTRVGRSSIWESALEAQLRQRLRQLPDLKRQIVSEQRELEDRIVQNQQLWTAGQPKRDSLRRQIAALPASDSQRQQLELALRQLQQQAVAPPLLGGTPQVSKRLVTLANCRTKLALSVFWIRSALPRLASEYERLAADLDVAETLRRLGHRLSSVAKYRAVPQELSRYERLVLTSWVPLYRQSGRYRVAAIINDQVPITLTYDQDQGRTLLTSNMVEAAGLNLAKEQNPVTVRVQGRTLRLHRVTIPYLRFGGCLLRDVAAYVLPPEGEDLGAQISSTAFKGFQVQAQPEQLRLVVAARS